MRFIAQRVAQIPIVVLAASALIFVFVQVLPGNPGRNALGPAATVEQVAAWNVAHGVDAGVLERYIAWLAGFVTGDWGTSIVYATPTFDLVLGRLGNSMALGLLAFALLMPVAIGIGILQALCAGSRRDRASTVILLALAAVPEFVIGVVLLIVFAVAIPVFPVQSGAAFGDGAVPELRALILPALTLAIGSLAVIARTTRSGIIDVTRSPHYRTAVVSGLGAGAIVRGHVARNALIPTVSILGVYLGSLLVGSAVVETLFGYPGLGELLVTATQRKDASVLAAGVTIAATVGVLAVLLADVAFTLIDPRVRFRGQSR
ncbi:ABC transporter permease [Agromyces atrinae]|uniref:Peptide/nickel transport system permease protein n=1 Tax=Agromyces atrinae TaxID=592376 RepID=A0A852SIG4_9MICO|nr:ABC transporter permease [Agromyces atrinae]NYD67691.1 peptide/nickel transport system permease protein [Agromyces atrinae]